MKRFVLFLFGIFICGIAIAQTISIDWKVGNNIYNQTTCEYGGDLNVPTAPTKYGYTFQGWATYVPIEYLESTGTQYIDTGVNLQNISYVIEATTNSTSTQTLLGIASTLAGATNAEEYQIGILQNTQPYIVYSNITTYNTSISVYKKYTYYGYVGLTSTLVIKEENGDIRCSITHNVNREMDFVTNFLLLKRVATNKPFNWVGKIYSCKLYDDNNNLIRDFIPVLDKDGVPCLFDKVENKFYYNAGTGQFIAGPVVTE